MSRRNNRPPEHLRKTAVTPPTGWDRLRWLGPGLLWMVASVGSGSVLFTPRVGSRYGLQLLWIALLGAFLTWVIIREIGRYTVVSGRTILDGYNGIPGPKSWAVWIIMIPGLASGIVMVAGLSGLVGSALMIALPGGQLFYGIIVIITSAALVVSGRYKGLERVTSIMAALLVATAVTTAIVVFPRWDRIGAGLIPNIPEDFDPYFVLPWVGFLLAGAAGVMWFSYWVSARGFGGEVEGQGGDAPSSQAAQQVAPGVDTRRRILISDRRHRHRPLWLRSDQPGRLGPDVCGRDEDAAARPAPDLEPFRRFLPVPSGPFRPTGRGSRTPM